MDAATLPSPPTTRHWITVRACIITALAITLAACSSEPLQPYSRETVPLQLVPASVAGVIDDRYNFGQYYCQLNEQVGQQLPDYRPCEDALVIPASGELKALKMPAVEADDSKREFHVVAVPGLGWECIRNYVADGSLLSHIQSLDYRLSVVQAEGLSSSGRNAQLIQQHLIDNNLLDGSVELIFLGYSKGVPDILEALQGYPEILPHAVAVISVAGAIGGSPLANTTSQQTLQTAFEWVPGSDCSNNDGGALQSLRPLVRQQWLADNPLPASLRYYSVVAYPQPENISQALEPSYKKLSQIDSRNDGQLLFYNQIIPGSKLLAYVNADHFAMAIPIARKHDIIASMAIDKNAFPRELLMQAMLHYVEADLKRQL